MSIEEALYLALDAHRGQVDLDGKPYILHPLRVGLSGQNDKEIIAGLLHDVIEDTKYTLQDIADKGAERDVVEALSLLTHKKNSPTANTWTESLTQTILLPSQSRRTTCSTIWQETTKQQKQNKESSKNIRGQ